MMTVDELIEMARLARENRTPERPDSPVALPKLLREQTVSEGWKRRRLVVEGDGPLQQPSS